MNSARRIGAPIVVIACTITGYSAYAYSNIRHALIPASETSPNGVEQQTDVIVWRGGGLYCSQNLATACVNIATGYIHIPKGDAADTVQALMSLYDKLPEAASYTGFSFAHDSVAGHQTQEVDGQFSISEALERMLRGSGLAAYEIDEQFVYVGLPAEIEILKTHANNQSKP